MTSDFEKAIKELVRKAETSHNRDDAMKFAQAALNLANALCLWRSAQNMEH